MSSGASNEAKLRLLEKRLAGAVALPASPPDAAHTREPLLARANNLLGDNAVLPATRSDSEEEGSPPEDEGFSIVATRKRASQRDTSEPQRKAARQDRSQNHKEGPHADTEHWQAAQLATRNAELSLLLLKESDLRKELEARLDALAAEQMSHMRQLREGTAALEEARRTAEAREAKVREEVIESAQQASVLQKADQAQRLRVATMRLGQPSPMSGGWGVKQVWEDGAAFEEVALRRRRLADQRCDINYIQEALKKKLPLPVGFKNRPKLQDQAVSRTLLPAEYAIQKEIFKARLVAIKREESMLNVEEEILNREKQQHIRNLELWREEENARFKRGAKLEDRYILQGLIGKGGFSEVYKALDLVQLRQVAVKIHQLSESWSSAKRANYIRHVTRELDIQKALRHPAIVYMFDVLELDDNSFATVLEFCDDGDLDAHLKLHRVLPEKEAKAVMYQIFQGLVYLNEEGRGIIHYDLKPANILFDRVGRVKITDFGLSKISEGGQQSMELTSQGAGTYWYLPPECFENAQTPPTISNKVDVWSAGVILYQMLYGGRPFGEGLTQEQVVQRDVMRNAAEVHFPATPKTSAECKAFIRRCLTRSQRDRPNVREAAEDAFLVLKAE